MSERSPGGSEILNHQPRSTEFELAPGDQRLIEAVTRHFDTHIGKAEHVFHEMISDLVHIDVHIIKPSQDHPYYTLYTSGMSERPMHPPEGSPERFYRAELMLKLRKEWKFKNLKDERYYWPIRWIKQIARLPHEHETFVVPGHTIPNGDPPEPFSDQTALCCLLAIPPMIDSEGVETFTHPDGHPVMVTQLVALDAKETELKLRKGAQAVLDRFANAGISDVIDPVRPSAVKPKRFGLF